ncbi:MAG: LamG-like jellyroll fold domain-containing protein [Patescibacteria group bacterium]
MKRAGFTLIELLLVVAISAVAMTTGFLYLGGYRSVQNLKLTANEMLSAIKNTQSLSKSQQDGKKWGIRFTNPTSSVSTGPTYSVFSGTSYAAGTVSRTYPLGRNISFTNPSASSTLDVIFNALTGYAPQNQVISLVSGRGDGIVNDIIMNTLGQITSKFDTGLVGYWHFDEATSTPAYDASGYGNTGTLTNSPTWQTAASCKVGGCLNFNGTTNYVNIADSSSLEITGNITIGLWVNPGATQKAYADLLSKHSNGGYVIEQNFNNTNQFAFGWDTTGAGGWDGSNTWTTLTSNIWQYFVVVKNGSAITHYVNGVQTATGFGISANISTNNLPVKIGDWSSGGGRQFNGFIDEVRIYNRALSATEISDIYNSTR